MGSLFSDPYLEELLPINLLNAPAAAHLAPVAEVRFQDTGDRIRILMDQAVEHTVAEREYVVLSVRDGSATLRINLPRGGVLQSLDEHDAVLQQEIVGNGTHDVRLSVQPVRPRIAVVSEGGRQEIDVRPGARGRLQEQDRQSDDDAEAARALAEMEEKARKGREAAGEGTSERGGSEATTEARIEPAEAPEGSRRELPFETALESEQHRGVRAEKGGLEDEPMQDVLHGAEEDMLRVLASQRMRTEAEATPLDRLFLETSERPEMRAAFVPAERFLPPIHEDVRPHTSPETVLVVPPSGDTVADVARLAEAGMIAGVALNPVEDRRPRPHAEHRRASPDSEHSSGNG